MVTARYRRVALAWSVISLLALARGSAAQTSGHRGVTEAGPSNPTKRPHDFDLNQLPLDTGEEPHAASHESGSNIATHYTSPPHFWPKRHSSLSPQLPSPNVFKERLFKLPLKSELLQGENRQKLLLAWNEGVRRKQVAPEIEGKRPTIPWVAQRVSGIVPHTDYEELQFSRIIHNMLLERHPEVGQREAIARLLRQRKQAEIARVTRHTRRIASENSEHGAASKRARPSSSSE